MNIRFALNDIKKSLFNPAFLKSLILTLFIYVLSYLLFGLIFIHNVGLGFTGFFYALYFYFFTPIVGFVVYFFIRKRIASEAIRTGIKIGIVLWWVLPFLFFISIGTFMHWYYSSYIG